MHHKILLLNLLAILFYACSTQKTMTDDLLKKESSAYQGLSLSVGPVYLDNPIPGVQSGVWARQGSKMLIIGGRIEGFHGLIESGETFSSKKANDNVIVVDFSTFTYSEVKWPSTDVNYLQFTGSNFEFSQVGDVLYIVGGYGRKNITDTQSNTTFGKMVSIQVSTMISQVESGGDPTLAVLNSVESPFLQVAGGEMIVEDGTFYLMMGQDYDVNYQVGVTGYYTNALRSFKFNGTDIYDTLSIVNPYLHRRDLNIEKVYSRQRNIFCAYGGVFTPDNNGYANPLYIGYDPGGMTFTEDASITQITNQYNCALASVYDINSDINTHFLMGGIGKNQYNVAEQKWEDGDNGALLPFVKSITQMIWQGGNLSQFVQIPPQYPELPELIGANAIFFPIDNLVYENNVIDYNKLGPDSTIIGYLYGGIKSPRPTSSAIYPTVINDNLYQLTVTKN